MLFFVFLCFLLFFAAVDGLGWCGDGPDVVGMDGNGSVLRGEVFFICFFQPFSVYIDSFCD